MISEKHMKGEVHLICDRCNHNELFDSTDDIEEYLQLFSNWTYKRERRLNGKIEHYCPECSANLQLY